MALQTMAVARQGLSGDHVTTPTRKQQLHINSGTVLSVRSVPRYYKQDKLARSESVEWSRLVSK
jgi:hypothetical protein